MQHIRLIFLWRIIKMNKCIFAFYFKVKESLSYAYRKFRSPFIISHYLSHNKTLKLHLGSGDTQLEGWLCTDLVPCRRSTAYLNAAKPFPFKDDTFDFVYSEHMIEHLTQQQGLDMLKECHRVLKPGGHIRIATPDMDVILKLYTDRANDYGKDYIKWSMDRFAPAERNLFGYDPMIVLNYFNHKWGHQFLYNYDYLTKAMEFAGFSHVSLKQMHQSDIPDLNNIENHHNAVSSDPMITFESLIVEAVKNK